MSEPVAMPIAYDSCIAALEGLLSDAKGLRKAAVMKLHLENFNLFNDTFGYDFGDRLLVQITDFLSSQGADVFRVGGVDFVLIFKGVGYTAALERAEAITDRFSSTWHIDTIDGMTAASSGVLLPPLEAVEPMAMMERLSYATADAGERGQNLVTVYDESLAGKQQFEHTVAEKLRWTMINAWDGLELRCRVSMNMAENRYTRAECYVRLYTREYGYSGAERFMPVADKTGTVCPLDLEVIRRTCALIRSLLDQGKYFESIAVPVSPVLFLQADIDKTIEEIINNAGIPADKLALEVTESNIINVYASVNVMMQQVADLGVELILTDFGTGYSGIANVLDLPIAALKLDRMLIWELETNPRSSVIVEGLVGIANKLGLKAIAEGVETQNQHDLLQQFGCPYQQGYYYAATVAMDELAGMLPDAE